MLGQLLRRALHRYRRWIAALVVLQLLNVVANLYLPALNARIIDRGLTQGRTDVIWQTGVVMLVIALGQGVVAAGAAYIGARTATGLGRDLRAEVFRAVGRFSSREMREFGTASLITRTTNDVQQIQMLVLMGCTILVMAPIMLVGGVVMALQADLGLSWIMAIAVPLLVAAIGFLVTRLVPGYRRLQETVDDVNGVLREQLTGVQVIRAFVREPFEIERFGRTNAELTQVSRRVARMMGGLSPLVMVVLNAAMVAVLWFGGKRVGDGSMQVGALTAYLTYLVMILMSVTMASVMVVMIPRAGVAASRIQEILDTTPSVTAPELPREVARLGGRVELDRAQLRYPGADEPVLRDVTLRAEPGQTIAVVGSTGAGKTTLLSLIARLLDVTDGAVRVDEIDVRDLDPDRLRSHVGLVPQKPFLFSGTVASNLRFGNPAATDAELWRALEVAQAAPFVRAMDGELEAPITQGGGNVSGGQRQRLSIARALVARPSIYLFDDAFSALDLSTEADLREALRPYARHATTFIAAQRISTICSADQIVVLEAGEVQGIGTHEELLTSCPTYGEIVASQLAEEVTA
ncbi:ABC transporter ATP-binding protein [Yimella sp. cx-573]|nr:ABC transporter ATP-binding protein [Yimella sp. cx-573]